MMDFNRIAAFASNNNVNLGLRIFLGGTFILSSESKLSHHTEFVEVVKDYDLLPEALASAYGNALPWVELFIGIYLLLAIMVRPSAFIALLMGISFMVANITAIVRGDEHCGSCFGELMTIPVEPAVALDVFILIAALGLFLFRSERQLCGLGSLFKPKEHQVFVEKHDS